MKYRQLVYWGTHNLGDIIQAIALSRLLPEGIGVFRDQPEWDSEGEAPLVVAGFLGARTAPRKGRALFAGVCALEDSNRLLDWFRSSPWTVGARDPETLRVLRSKGISVDLVGCVTLTFDRYDGPRKGELSVDCGASGLPMTHWIHGDMSVETQWQRALRCLEAYRTAELVHTTRLHVALPCLAFGTPVRFVGPWDERTSILKTLGMPYNAIWSTDVTSWRNRYLSFLKDSLGVEITVSEPKMPEILPKKSGTEKGTPSDASA